MVFFQFVSQKASREARYPLKSKVDDFCVEIFYIWEQGDFQFKTSQESRMSLLIDD